MNLVFPINKLSYGLTATNILYEMHRENTYYSLFNIGPLEKDIHPKFHIPVKEGLHNNATYNKYDDSIRLFHQFSLAEHVGKGLHIGFPIFELDTFNIREQTHLNNCDRLMVCSKWAKEVLENNNIKPEISIVNLGVDRTIFNERNSSSSKKTKFFTIGKLEYRKGHDLIHKVFHKAFKDVDNVELIMMINNSFAEPHMMQSYKKECIDLLGDKVKFIDNINSPESLSEVMGSIDCGLFLSRAEGWNLGLTELLSCGKMVIATNYSGHTEQCNDLNSLLIDIDEKEKAIDNIWFNGQGNWATIGQKQIDQTVDYLRFVHKRKQLDGQFINVAGIETAKNLSWNNTFKQLFSYKKE